MAKRNTPATAVSNETAFVLEPDEIRLLTEIGFLAAGSGDLPRASAIFNALHMLRPDRAFPLVGLAVTHMNASMADEAVKLLERAHCDSASEQALLDAWRGFALQLAGHTAQSRQLLETVLRQDNGDAAKLASALLGRNQPAETSYTNSIAESGS